MTEQPALRNELVLDLARPSAGLLPGVRMAEQKDVRAILELVQLHVRRGDLLPRSEESIRETLSNWAVLADARGVVGCGALNPYSPILVEVRSLAVQDRGKGNGYGTALVQYLLELARRREYETVFTLTRAVRFFQRLGFVVTDREHYPQKVWRDCRICPIEHRCDETAMEYSMSAITGEKLNGSSSGM